MGAASMCGILMTTSPQVSSEAWQRGLNALASRGPDARGEFQLGDVRFGHTRLAVIGLGQQGAQPAVSAQGSVLVFNGELYNYKTLAAEFQLSRALESDTDVLSHLMDLESTGWIGRLRGMYAFVHFNPNTQTVTAVRDPMGIKPLCLGVDGHGQLTFGSTPAAVATVMGTTAPDPVGIAGFVGLGVFGGTSTAFAAIRHLEPGLRYRWQRTAHGWRQTVEELPPPHCSQLSVEAALQDSVDAHLVSDVEVGVMLSGGIDSTLIAALASNRHPSPLRTFTLTYPHDPALDESAAAAANARTLGSRHTEVPVTTVELVDQVEPLIRTSGEPFSDEAYLPLSLLSQAIGAELKVALAGEGADEIFGGYRRYEVEAAFDRGIAGTVLRHMTRLYPPTREAGDPMSQLHRTIRAAALPDPADRHAALMFGDWELAIQTMGVSATLAHQVFASDWRGAQASWWALGQPPNRAYDTRVWLPKVFLAKSDRASMVHGLEIRTPFIDPVVAAAARPIRHKGTSKAAIKELLLRTLPDARVPRRKRGLDADRRAILASHLQADLEAVIFDPSSVLWQAGLSDPGELSAQARRSPALAFRLAMLGTWQRLWL